MLVGIVADTHDNLDLVEAAVETFEERDVETVVHCGDIVAPFSAAPFDADFAFHAVRGNNDGEWALQSAIDEFGTYHGETAELTLDGTELGVYHGTSEAIVEALVASANYDYVLHGHTHERTHEVFEGTVQINPGGIAFAGAPEPFSVAVLDTETGEVEFEELA
ncbi:metallophosphoesterase [Halobacteria archaeon HArc-gm2]|nr:metallophosphoesterase [Halobacteria archaeon HArc-gm2]